MDLQEYDFQVQHRPGTQNGNSDALSSLPQGHTINTILPNRVQPESTLPTTVVCLTMLGPENNLQQAQLEDTAIAKVIELKTLGFPKLPYFAWA